MFDLGMFAELSTGLAGLDERRLTDVELMDGVRGLEQVRRFLDGAQGAMLAELDARGSTDMADGLRTGSWLARETGISPAAARARVRLGSALRTDLPVTDRAVREGWLCRDRAKVMAGAVNDRIVAEFGAMEAALVDEAASMTFGEWKLRVELVAALLDEDGPAPADDPSRNRLRFSGGSGGTKVGGELVGDLAVSTRHAVEQVADELWRRYRRDAEETGGAVEVPGRAQLLAEALGELCRRGVMVGEHGRGTAPRVEASLVVYADTPETVFDPFGYRSSAASRRRMRVPRVRRRSGTMRRPPRRPLVARPRRHRCRSHEVPVPASPRRDPPSGLGSGHR